MRLATGACALLTETPSVRARSVWVTSPSSESATASMTSKRYACPNAARVKRRSAWRSGGDMRPIYGILVMGYPYNKFMNSNAVLIGWTTKPKPTTPVFLDLATFDEPWARADLPNRQRLAPTSS